MPGQQKSRHADSQPNYSNAGSWIFNTSLITAGFVLIGMVLVATVPAISQAFTFSFLSFLGAAAPFVTLAVLIIVVSFTLAALAYQIFAVRSPAPKKMVSWNYVQSSVGRGRTDERRPQSSLSNQSTNTPAKPYSLSFKSSQGPVKTAVSFTPKAAGPLPGAAPSTPKGQSSQAKAVEEVEVGPGEGGEELELVSPVAPKKLKVEVGASENKESAEIREEEEPKNLEHKSQSSKADADTEVEKLQVEIEQNLKDIAGSNPVAAVKRISESFVAAKQALEAVYQEIVQKRKQENQAQPDNLLDQHGQSQEEKSAVDLLAEAEERRAVQEAEATKLESKEFEERPVMPRELQKAIKERLTLSEIAMQLAETDEKIAELQRRQSFQENELELAELETDESEGEQNSIEVEEAKFEQLFQKAQRTLSLTKVQSAVQSAEQSANEDSDTEQEEEQRQERWFDAIVDRREERLSVFANTLLEKPEEHRLSSEEGEALHNQLAVELEMLQINLQQAEQTRKENELKRMRIEMLSNKDAQGFGDEVALDIEEESEEEIEEEQELTTSIVVNVDEEEETLKQVIEEVLPERLLIQARTIAEEVRSVEECLEDLRLEQKILEEEIKEADRKIDQKKKEADDSPRKNLSEERLQESVKEAQARLLKEKTKKGGLENQLIQLEKEIQTAEIGLETQKARFQEAQRVESLIEEIRGLELRIKAQKAKQSKDEQPASQSPRTQSNSSNLQIR